MTRWGPSRAERLEETRRLWASWELPTKEEAVCCVMQFDDLGRPPIGFCGPDCIRRTERPVAKLR